MRKFLKDNKIKVTNLQENEPDELPFKVFEYQDFQILVGKNSKNNDLLTQKYAYKEDLWLHARGVAGSHVVIKYRAGKPFPKSVIEKAASLAAYYSKSKSDSLCAVIVTPKKYVRKPKGAALGAVVVEREDVVMVEPKEFG
jgi:predicted ribosome quality control (RQC) complex YloA/Tae2 family protein